jgi:hypothetical protein
MKKTIIVASVVFAFGYAVAIAGQFAGLVSFNVFSLPALIGGLVASGMVGLVFSDYAQRPRFRVRRSPETGATEIKPVFSDAGMRSCDWTYTTRSA